MGFVRLGGRQARGVVPPLGGIGDSKGEGTGDGLRLGLGLGLRDGEGTGLGERDGAGDGLSVGGGKVSAELCLLWAAAGLDVVDSGETAPTRAAQTPTRAIVK